MTTDKQATFGSHPAKPWAPAGEVLLPFKDERKDFMMTPGGFGQFCGHQ